MLNWCQNNIGIISKNIIGRAYNYTKNALGMNQWRNAAVDIEWFSNINKKGEWIFLQFDISDFYPSILEHLLTTAIILSENYCHISNQEINITKAQKPTFYHYKLYKVRKITKTFAFPCERIILRKHVNLGYYYNGYPDLSLIYKPTVYTERWYNTPY